ncbi:GDP-fucose protein O-fucosyltransferase 2-like [Littorina saxatilis]|uniref:GDP-fucose protein O-fucosyltransferase 2 n=1 Tax=Littorina saxatilis TaxID=31220 RepID=A0AAN9ALC5_9CAEN
MNIVKQFAFISVLHMLHWKVTLSNEGVIDSDLQSKTLNVGEAKAPRYLLYDVNPGEGFNLRRDVYMRVANLVRNLNEDAPWILVLPPWGGLYHWKSRHLDQTRIPWSTFFDLPSLRRFVPVIEFKELLKLMPEPVIDELYYLQNYKEGWTEFEDKMDIRDCIQNPYHFNEDRGLWEGWFFSYGDEVGVRKLTCVSLLGHSALLKPFLLHNTTARTVMTDRAETMLHDRFGDKNYWECRRSMRFSKALRDIGDEFRRKYLDSTDEKDNTVLHEDWTQMKRKHGEAKGGPYVAAHLRRADFLYARPKDVPSLENTAKQLKAVLKKQKLKTLFIATDAPKDELKELKDLLRDYKVYTFEPPKEVLETYKDGGIAIIDQWICAHARYFIGTYESTFSFRIGDEREILGFDPDMTYNRVCGDEDKECEQPSRWTIVYK